jgi:hypothetical protein
MKMSPVAWKTVSKLLLVVFACSAAATLLSACAGPAYRHDARVDHRVDRRDDRYDRRDNRWD